MASNHEADVDVTQPDLIDEKMASLEVESSDAEDAASQIRILALDMQQRCRVLLEELQQFHDYLKQQKREKAVESKLFGNRLKSEMKVIDRVSACHMSIELMLTLSSLACRCGSKQPQNCPGRKLRESHLLFICLVLRKDM